MLKRFGVILTGLAWDSDSEQLLESAFTSSDPLMRRAAFFSLGQNERAAVAERAVEIAGDPSDKVRAVLPQVFSNGGNYWIHYFDDEHFTRSYQSSSSSSRNRKTSLPTPVLQAFKQLSKDTTASIRLEAFFALLGAGQEADPANLQDTLNQFADRDSMAPEFGDYLDDHFQSVDPSNAFLLDYADHTQLGYRKDDIYRHFKYKPVAVAAPLELPF